MEQKFKILALGGLNENGKNAYIIETDKEMILIEAGSSNFTNKSLGIDIIIPDFSYVIKNKNKLKAIFISHGHLDQMGALPYIINELNVPVYGSYYTIEFLKTYIDKKNFKLLKEIKYSNALMVGSIKVEVFSLSHAIFGNFGFVFSKKNDAIVYTTDYNFNQSDNKFARTDIKKLIEITSKYNVVAFMTESIAVENEGVATGNLQFMNTFNRFVESAPSRIIISLYASNLAGMTNVIKMAEKYNKKIVIIGRDLLTYVNIARNLNYISHKKDIFVRINDMNKHKENLIVVVSGLYLEPFLMLEKMSTNNNNLIKITEEDSVLISSKPYDEIEGQAQDIVNVIARTGAQISTFNINAPSHAYQEDVKMMLNFIDPKYIIPIKGEFRKQRTVQQLAIEVGKNKEDVLLLGNGEILSIYDDYSVVEQSIKISSTLISETENNPISPIILADREVLADNGYVLLIMSFYKDTDKLVQEPEIVSGGLSSFDEDENIIEGCKKIIFTEIKKNHSNRELVNKLKAKVTRYLQNHTGKTPMILPVRMDIDPKRIKGNKNGK